jgi:hypothetical protein
MKHWLLALVLFLPCSAWAAEADLYWLGGTSSGGGSIFIPLSTTNPLPITSVTTRSLTPVAGAQYGLAIATSTALTVPATATIATVTVEGNSLRYTSDGATAPTTSVGMGPFAIGTTLTFNLGTGLANLRFIQVAASSTIDVEYFK